MRKTQREKKQTVRNSRTEKHEEYGSEIHTKNKRQNNRNQKNNKR